MRLLSTTVVMAVVVATTGVSLRSQDTSRPVVSAAEYERWQTSLSNWGRWGPNDEMGTLNLVTDAKRRAALALVREGVTVSLSSNVEREKQLDVPCPAEWSMVNVSEGGGATDRIGFPCIHGAGTTHLDAFAHKFFGGKMWNGYLMKEYITREGGATRNSLITMKNGIVTRAVLYDIARLKGVPYLAPGTRIFPEDFEAWERRTGVKVGPGDALLVRWGRWARRSTQGVWNVEEQSAGLDPSVLPWMKQRDISILGWETPAYMPQPPGDLPRLAVHDFVLTILGIHILDRADFEAVAEAAAARKRWEFMLTIAPLAIPNGTGSPVNPLAMF